ncbi:MAG: DNA gyrase subunit A [Clostridia bacterium]|nr:DNA gyrase subunit A [Clostridia bacterium]
MDELNNNVENTGVTQGVNNLPDPYANQKIINVDINKEVRTSFLDYSMSVIVSRALPDVRDGLKPVHRRILYTMYENNLTPDKAYRKCADTVGSVLGRYHPHGDASVYDAMVRLAQNFSMRYMLVDGHGNFGSVDGDPPAAYRYTESRMSKMSLEMLTDIEKNTVDFVPNYDDRLKEPTVLPSRYPNLLVNGSQGIAVGMATNIPPHNLREVIDAICCVIDNPEAELEDIMEHIKGPDFPTAGIIMGRSGIRSAYATGRGKVIVRAKSEIVEGKNGRFKIIITEIPYMVNKARLIESIADLVKDKRVEGIADINDYSSEKTGMHIEIDIKRDANAQVVLNKLFTYTQLQSTFGVILLAIVNGEPKILTLKEILQNYIDFQCQIIERRTQFELKKAEERKHILDGLKKAIDIVDDIIATIRACKGGQQEAKTAIMEKFDFDEPQAAAIVAFRLGQLAGLEILKITNELNELEEKIKEYRDILGSHERVLSIIKDEITVIRNKFGDDRRTAIENVSGEVDIEDLIPEETCMYTYTTMGYIKRQPVDLFAAQHRGGRGVKGMTRREDDVAETMFISSSHDYVMFLTTKGRAFRLKGYEIPEGSKNSKGMNIVNLLPLENGEKISAMLSIPSDDEGKFLCMFTKKGLIKRTALSLYKNIRKNGLNAISLREDDELVFVKLTSGNDDLLLATKKGMCIHINETNARPLGRTATGVKAITLKEGDEVAGVAVLHEGGKVLTVSETGYGRRSEISDYRLQSRGGKGLKNYHVEKYGDVTAVSIVDDDEDIILISQDGIIIRIPADAVRVCARPSKGVKVMKVTGEDRVVTLSTTEHDEEEVNGDVEDDGSAEEGAGDTSGDNEDVGTPDDEVEENEADTEADNEVEGE